MIRLAALGVVNSRGGIDTTNVVTADDLEALAKSHLRETWMMQVDWYFFREFSSAYKKKIS